MANAFEVGDRIICKSMLGLPVRMGDVCTIVNIYKDQIYYAVKQPPVYGAWAYKQFPDDFELVVSEPLAIDNDVVTHDRDKVVNVIRPRREIEQERVIDLLKAMLSAAELSGRIPKEWVEEFNEKVQCD